MSEETFARTADTTADAAVDAAADEGGIELELAPATAAVELKLLPWLARRVLFIGSLLLVGFVVYSGVEGLLQANSLDERISQTRTEITQLRQDADQLAALISWLDSDVYIERIAREDLGMVRPGEESFAVHAPNRGQLDITRTPWWANLLPPESEGAGALGD